MFEAIEDSRYCPVNLVRTYFERLGYEKTDSGFFLPKVRSEGSKTIEGKRVFIQTPIKNEHISYNTCLLDRRRLLNRIGLPGEEFSEHSDRTGGMSQIINSGVAVEDAQRHGRWKSLESARKYIKVSEKNKRKVSAYFFKND